MNTIGFIGAGNMAEAIISGLIEKGVYRPESIYASDLSRPRLDYMQQTHNVQVCQDNSSVIEKADAVVLAVKPQMAVDVLKELAFPSDKLLISIAAGLTISKITDALGNVPVIRVMPNTPALVGCGAAGIYCNEKAKSLEPVAMKIFASIGEAVIVDSEDQIDTVTAISGSGPAYFFLMIEEMIKAGVELGMDEDLVAKLTIQTALGAAMLAKQAAKTGETPEQLRHKVTSPGGTTQAALKVFQEDQLGAIVLLAMTRAKERSKELSEM